MPPMRMTMILEPIELPDKVVDEKSKLLFSSLDQKNYDNLITFEDFLMEMGLAEDEYFLLIQCTLKQPTIFLK
jgi:hypothetical protein